MLKEFEGIAMRGNVMDFALAAIIGGAFGKIIASLVKDVLRPLIGIVPGGDFSELTFTVGDPVVKRGAFVESVIDFGLATFAAIEIIMLVRILKRFTEPQPVAAPTKKECPRCFTALPITARRGPNCLSQL